MGAFDCPTWARTRTLLIQQVVSKALACGFRISSPGKLVARQGEAPARRRAGDLAQVQFRYSGIGGRAGQEVSAVKRIGDPWWCPTRTPGDLWVAEPQRAAPGRAQLRPAGGPRRVGPQAEHMCGESATKNGTSSRQHPELNPIAGTPPSDQGPGKVLDSFVQTRVREAGSEPSAPFPKLDNIWSGRRDQIAPGSGDPTRPIKQALQEGELVVGEDQGPVLEPRLPSVAHWTFKAGCPG
jgi:hypothetical protein